jgi:hypoxanthine phosphoribosyltransferase
VPTAKKIDQSEFKRVERDGHTTQSARSLPLLIGVPAEARRQATVIALFLPALRAEVAMDWLNIGLGLLGVIGTAGTFYFGLKVISLERQRYRFSWGDVESASAKLSAKCIRRFKADAILTFSGPGQIAAGLAMLDAGRLIPVYTIIDIYSEDGGRFPAIPGYIPIKTTRWKSFVPEALRGISDKRLAIIDDCTVTGDTLIELLGILQGFGFSRDRVITGVLVCSQLAVEANKAPDVYGYCVEHASYHFPWGERF